MANTLKYNQKIVEKSDLSETLVKSLALLENDVAIKIAVLNVLQRLSQNSGELCKNVNSYSKIYACSFKRNSN